MTQTSRSNVEWRDIPGYEGLYETSNTGLVRTKSGKITHTEKHGMRRWQQRVLKEKNPSGRDVRVSLWKDGKHKDFLVHRLVALTFIGEPPVGKDSINHIDGNPRNNEVSNLEWCDHNGNNNHAFDNGLIGTGIAITLEHIETQATFVFRSMAYASKFIGRNNGFVSGKLKKGVTSFDGYRVIGGEAIG